MDGCFHLIYDDKEETGGDEYIITHMNVHDIQGQLTKMTKTLFWVKGV